MNLSLDHEARDGLALVEFVVRRHFGRLAAVPKDELIGYGSLGLVKAVRDYNPDKGTAFGSYAYQRIRGAIADGLRAVDPLSRGDRRLVNAANSAWAKLAQDLGREPTFVEVAELLEADGDALDRACKAETPYSTDHVQLHDSDAGEPITLLETLRDPEPTPEEYAMREETADELARHVARLPAPERLAVAMSADGATGAEIGQVLDVTASRVSQLYTKGLKRLHGALEQERLAA